MVVRFWSARTTQVRFPDYLQHFNEHVLPRLRALEGFQEARILSKSDGVVVEFIVETLWASIEAIQKFAGSDPLQAVVAEEALSLLTSYEHRVSHYQLEMRADGSATNPRA